MIFLEKIQNVPGVCVDPNVVFIPALGHFYALNAQTALSVHSQSSWHTFISICQYEIGSALLCSQNEWKCGEWVVLVH